MIVFQYKKDCKNAIETLKNLFSVRAELNIPYSEINIQISNSQSAEENKFQGSPTILIDGIDIYTDSKPNEWFYSCRLYSFNGANTGIIPREFIRKKVMQLRLAQFENGID